jgi:hypothetical protein
MKVRQIQKTIDYSSVFKSRLALEDLHHWFISPKKSSLKSLSSFLNSHPSLKKQLVSLSNEDRQKKTRLTQKKLKSINPLVSFLKRIPTINLIALTGSLSVNNPSPRDDIDLMIVTSPNTLWLTRPLVILATSLLSKRRKPNQQSTNNHVCINLWLDRKNLTVPKKKQNLYTAHEVLQIKPFFDRGGVYHQFIKANSWVKSHLANAYATVLEVETPHQSTGHQAIFKILTLPIKILNLLVFNLQYLYMKRKITNEHITPHVAYFHPRDFYSEIKKRLSSS